MFRQLKIARGISIPVFIFFFSASTCFAGAWTMPQGKLYGRTALNYYSADENFDADGDRETFSNNGEFFDANATVYIEYGLCRDLTLIGNLVYKHLEYEDDTVISKSYGVGDVELGVRYPLLETQGGMFSAQGLVKIPEAYDKTDDVPLGNGQYDLELKLLFGKSLYPVLPGYINIEAGYRFRDEQPADAFRYLIEVGGDFTDKLYGRVKLDGILGVGNETTEPDTTGNPTATNDYDIGKLDLCMGYKLTEKYGVELGFTPAIYGKNTAAGSTWTIALTIQL